MKKSLMEVPFCLGASLLFLLTLTPSVHSNQAGGSLSVSNFWTFEGQPAMRVAPELIPDAMSELYRGEDEVCVSLDTTLLPDGAFTIWWIIFNNPENCENPEPVGNAQCGTIVDLLGTPAANPTFMQGTAGIVGPDGSLHASACLGVGVENAPFGVPFGPGLQNVEGAEIHVLLKNHGPAAFSDPMLLGEQLTNIDAGVEPPCDFSQDPGFMCPVPQFAIHPVGVDQDCNRDGVINGLDLLGIGCPD